MNLEEMISPDGLVQPTTLSRKVPIDGVGKVYPVYRIRLDQLHYNNQNDRIATYISQYKAEHNDTLPPEDDLEAYNDIIEEFIVKSNEKAIDRTAKNIKMVGQNVPAIVLSNGLVIDGNRRFTCLRILSRDDDKFNWIDAVILPEEIAQDKKRIKKLELALQHGEEGKIDYNPIDRLVGIYNDIVKTGLFSIEEYARDTNTTPGEVKKLVEQSRYLIEFLDFINAPGEFYLARDMELNGPIIEIPAILKYCADEDEAETVKQCIFANMVVEPAGDITRFVRKFKKVLKSPMAKEFIENETELAEEVVDRLSKMETINKETIRNEIRSDQKLIDRFANTMSASEAKANGAIILDSPVSKLDAAVDLLDGVDVNILGHLDNDNMKRAIRALNNLEGRIEEIRSFITKEQI